MSATPAVTAQSQACADCGVYRAAQLKKLGVNVEKWNFVVALAGNPNTGKSTVFNALTGLRQHTGNWPGKTVAKLVLLRNLPGSWPCVSACCMALGLQEPWPKRGYRRRIYRWPCFFLMLGWRWDNSCLSQESSRLCG